MTSTLELVPTKSVEDRVSNSIKKFLRRWCLQYAADATKENGINGRTAAQLLKLSQGYVSEMLKFGGQRKPGLALVIRLRENTGASFEEITGHRTPLTPKYPLRVLEPDREAAEAAAGEAVDNERDSGTFRGAQPPSFKRPRR